MLGRDPEGLQLQHQRSRIPLLQLEVEHLRLVFEHRRQRQRQQRDQPAVAPLHAQRVVAEPRAILSAAGFEVIETDELGLCCGAAGMYTVSQPEASEKLGEQKADQVRATGSKRVASANPGCEMQLRSHLGDGFEIKHPIEWYLHALEDAERS